MEFSLGNLYVDPTGLEGIGDEVSYGFELDEVLAIAGVQLQNFNCIMFLLS